MAYNKHTWTTQELITADKLNNIEDGVDVSIKNQPNIEMGTHSLTSINNNKIANLSNLLGYYIIQDVIIDPRTGYRYIMTNQKSSSDTHETEDLVIIELDEFLRYRTNMKVTHGITKTSWLHGQFTQFDYYNNDEDKVMFLLGGPGESVRLEYKPYSTSKYDELPVFFTVAEKASYSQAIDFDNNRAVSVILNKDTTAKTYTFNFYMYNLDPDTGSVTKAGSYSDTIDIPDGYISQGCSAAPASSYLNTDSDGTMIFMTSGLTNTDDGSYTEMSIRTYLIENGTLTPYSTIKNLEKAGGYSTSNTQPRSGYIDVRKYGDQVKNVKYREVEGSSQVKIGDKWVFTTTLVASQDTSFFADSSSYSSRNMEIYQLGFGDTDLVDSLRNIGKQEFVNYMGIESLVDNLYTVIQKGTYQISPTLLPKLNDVPYFLRQGTDKETIGGSGLDSIQLDVSYQGLYGRIKQVLTLQTYSYNTHADLKFERTIRTNFTIGGTNNPNVGMWEMTPMNLIGNWDVFPQVKKTTDLLIPGSKKFITKTKLASFFADDAFLPVDSGVLEVLPTSILPEGDMSVTRIVQKFTTYGDDIHVYQRSITVRTDQVGSVFPAGIGGGYPGYSSLGTWKELTN